MQKKADGNPDEHKKKTMGILGQLSKKRKFQWNRSENNK